MGYFASSFVSHQPETGNPKLETRVPRPFLLLTTFLLATLGCRYDHLPEPELEQAPGPVTERFLHLGHTYVPYLTYQDIDTFVERADYSRFAAVMLGGDLFPNTSLDPATLQWADSIFDFRDEKTLWAIGNHDYDDPWRVRDLVGRPLYYSWYHNGITFLVLDTQDSLSNIVGDQLLYARAVLDTVRESKQVFVLTHKMIWMADNGPLQAMIDSVSNGYYGSCFFCVNPNNFYTDIYPLLVQLKDRGIGVWCIAGDIGYKVRRFEHTTADDIRLLAGGMCSLCGGDNYYLEFSWTRAENRLEYSYRPIETLVE